MKVNKHIVLAACCVMLLCIAFLPSVMADEWNKKTKATFNAPVELPGMALPAGTYVFKLLDSAANRNIVQVFNADESHLYGTFLTIPDYRLQPSDQTVINFAERAANAPLAVKAWFYPGDSYGQDFVYPRAKAEQLAQANKMSVLSMPSEMAEHITKPAKSATEPSVVALKQATVMAVTPEKKEVAAAEVIGTKPSASSQPQTATQPQTTTQATSEPSQSAMNERHLPRTASPWPLVGLIGVFCLGVGGAVQLASRRIH